MNNKIGKPIKRKIRKLDLKQLADLELEVIMAKRGDKVLSFWFCHARKIFCYNVDNSTGNLYSGTDFEKAVEVINE
jgi:hypothetical protein